VALPDPIVSDLPAPDVDGPGGGGGVAQAGTRDGGSTSGSETTRQLGDAVSNVSPEAGSALGDTGTALDQAVGVTAPSLSP
jgi:hypothetical protein